MIRTNKSVKLLEWDLGTNTTNQRWREMAEGKVLSVSRKNGLTTMAIEIKGRLAKQNPKDEAVKVVQLGEGMTPLAQRWENVAPHSGEVALGKIRSVEDRSIKSIIQVEISNATKTSRASE